MSKLKRSTHPEVEQRAKPHAQTSKPKHSPKAEAYDIGTRHPRLEVLFDAYRATGNPLALWEAWRLCRKHGLPVPPELLGYLDKVATALLDKKHARRRNKRAEDTAKRTGDIAAKALKLNTSKKGGSSFFNKHHISDREYGWARYALKLAEKSGKINRSLHDTAKNYGVSYPSVRAAYYAWVHLLFSKPKH